MPHLTAARQELDESLSKFKIAEAKVEECKMNIAWDILNTNTEKNESELLSSLLRFKGETTNLINSMHQKDTIHDAVIDLNNEAVEAKIQFYKARIMAGLSTMDRLRSQREAAASGGQAGAAGGQAPV